MQCIHTKRDLKTALRAHQGEKIVLVPTMGALHRGHAGLLHQARELAGETGIVVSTIFLNPVQFDNAGDLQAYPVSPDQDLALCAAEGVDYVFMPSTDEMYCSNRSMRVEEDVLSSVLCGAKRPGHFAGVCLVVLKLFHLVCPTDAIFGKKDYQQLAILRRMVRDLDVDITLHGAEIIREEDGLAFSSRNVRLSQEHRAYAPLIHQLLTRAKVAYEDGVADEMICEAIQIGLEAIDGVKVDYVSLVDAEDLQALKADSKLALLALAAYFGEVRLIDNIEIPLT